MALSIKLHTISQEVVTAAGYNLKKILYSKTCIKQPLSKTENGFQDRLLLNAGQSIAYCRMFQREHSAIHSTFIKLPVVIQTFILSIFDLTFYKGFTVLD